MYCEGQWLMPLTLMHCLLLAELGSITQDLDGPTKEELAAVLTPEVVLPGHNLCEAGDPADCLWILQSGAPQASGRALHETGVLPVFWLYVLGHQLRP